MQQIRTSVLVVEDQEPVRNLLGRLLAKQGLDVELVASGEEALARLGREHAFGAIVSDLLMAGVHGIAFLKLVRELAPSVPLIVLTGSEISAGALDVAGCRVAAYLRKPLETSRVADVVSAVVARGAEQRGWRRS